MKKRPIKVTMGNIDKIMLELKKELKKAGNPDCYKAYPILFCFRCEKPHIFTEETEEKCWDGVRKDFNKLQK